MTLTENPTHAESTTEIDLNIEGMTCASCVSRVEKKLNIMDGVEATVNLPLESAHVKFPVTTPTSDLIEAVKSAGYQAHVKEDHVHHQSTEHNTFHHENHMDHGPENNVIKPRLITAGILTLPIFLISMIPALQFPTGVGRLRYFQRQ